MLKTVVAAVSLAAVSSVASAALLVSEPFNYTSGQPLLGQTNTNSGTVWQRAASQTTTTALNIGAGNLTAPITEPPASGNSLAITGIGNVSGGANRLAFAPAANPNIVTTGTVYYSFVMNVTSLTGSNNTAGGFFIGLNNTGDAATTTNPTTVGAKLQMRIDPTDATKFDMEVCGNRNAAAADTTWQGPFALNNQMYIVAAYDFSTFTSSLWINPGSLGNPTAPPPTQTDSTEVTHLAQIGSIIARQSPAPQMVIDELRVATDWQFATSVPEPTMLGMIGLAGVGMLRRRRPQ